MNAGEDTVAEATIADGTIARDTIAADVIDDDIMADHTALATQTSQLFQSFSLLEPPERTDTQMDPAPLSDLPPTHVQTGSFLSNFQLQSPAESPIPAMLLDLQSHDRQSHGQESTDWARLPLPAAILDDQQRPSQHTEDWGVPGGLLGGRSDASAALQPPTQTDCMALGTPSARAAMVLPQQREGRGMGLPQLSSGSHSQIGAGFLQPRGHRHSQDGAAVEDLPFALSSSSSRGQSHSHPSGSSCSSYTRISHEAGSSSKLLSMVQPDEEEEVVHVLSEKTCSTSEEGSGSEAAPQLTHSGRGHLSSSHVVMESSSSFPTAAADMPQLPAISPQLWAADTVEAAPDLVSGVDGLPHLPVGVVAETLQQRATAQPPPMPPPLPLPLTSDLPPPRTDLPQLTVATALMPGSPTGALLPGTGIDLLDRPGSSPLPVSKMLRMVSEDQASLLSDLAAQCAAPGGLLGPGPTEQVQDFTRAFGVAPTREACSPSSQAVPDSMGNQNCSAQQSQHAQRSLRRHTSPRLECSADTSHQVSAASSAPGRNRDESYLQSAQTHRSPLRKRLSQFFSPIFGSVSPHSTHVQQSHLQQPLLQSARQAQAQQQLLGESLVTGLVQNERPAQLLSMHEEDAAVGEPVVWQLLSPHLPAAALLATGPSAGFPHGGLLCLFAMIPASVLLFFQALAVCNGNQDSCSSGCMHCTSVTCHART